MLRNEIISDVERLCQKTETSINRACKTLGISKPRFYEWKKRKHCENKHNALTPKQNWILPLERCAVIDYFYKNPNNGCRRLSYMMIDDDVAYVSSSTVHRILKGEGLIDTKPQGGSKKGTGFTQPKTAHEQWHIDISYINAGGTFYYLCSILDGYSRSIIHWEIQESMKEAQVELIVQRALEKIDHISPRLISDNGPQFRAREFQMFVKLCGMDQTFTSPYYPQSNGKIERWHKELKQNCIRVKQPQSLDSARKYVEGFIKHYNNVRLHSAIGYITPTNKLLGKDVEILRERKNKLALARQNRQRVWKNLELKSTSKFDVAESA